MESSMLNNVLSSINAVSLDILISIVYLFVVAYILKKNSEDKGDEVSIGFAIYLSFTDVRLYMDDSRKMYYEKDGVHNELSYLHRRYEYWVTTTKIILVTILHQILITFR